MTLETRPLLVDSPRSEGKVGGRVSAFLEKMTRLTAMLLATTTPAYTGCGHNAEQPKTYVEIPMHPKPGEISEIKNITLPAPESHK